MGIQNAAQKLVSYTTAGIQRSKFNDERVPVYIQIGEDKELLWRTPQLELQSRWGVHFPTQQQLLAHYITIPVNKHS
jgi:hypothetical protein